MAKVAIVMLGFNKLAYTKKCVESVYKHTDKDFFHYILIDNGSEDDTANYFDSVKEKEGNVTVIKSPVNLGFGQGMSIGVSKATELGFEYVCLLNNDIEVLSGWLNNLYNCITSEEKIGAVQSAVLSFDDQSISCGIATDLHEQHYLRQCDLSDKSPERIYLNGACLMINVKCINEVGFFDREFFPNYHEETDFCIRAHQKGWKMLLCRDSQIHHHEAVTYKTLPGAEGMFWDHWQKVLDKHSWYFYDQAEQKYGLEFNKSELHNYGKSLDIGSSSKILAKEWNAAPPKTKEEIDEFYKTTENYIGDLIAWNNNPYKKSLIDHVLYSSKFFGIESVLDIGAGILSDTIKMRNIGLKVTSLDFDSEHYNFGQWRLAQRRIKDVNLRYVGDHLKSHDAIIMFDVIEHIEDPDKFLDYYAGELAKKVIFMTVPENIPPDEKERHPMHLVQYADLWKKIPQYLERFGYRRVDLITFVKE